jgi:hypothetical protein
MGSSEELKVESSGGTCSDGCLGSGGSGGMVLVVLLLATSSGAVADI